jgi:hypothetical protein
LYFIFFFNYFIMTQTIGSRRQVWNGNAKHTSGGLTKSDLTMSHGRIVSKAKHISAKKEMRLLKHGYGTKKGKFGFVKVGTKRNRKMRGGMGRLSPLQLTEEGNGIAGQGITPGGPQTLAGMAGGRASARASARARSYGMAGGDDYQPQIAGGSKSLYGGSGMQSLSPQGSAAWSGDGISGSGLTDFGAGSVGLQMQAGMSGGRRRRNSRGRRGQKKTMRGGTTSQRFALSPLELGENSTDVQFAAGRGN